MDRDITISRPKALMDEADWGGLGYGSCPFLLSDPTSSVPVSEAQLGKFTLIIHRIGNGL